jgi:hypothetical protein
MRMPARLLLAAGVLTLLSGCTYLDTFTGQTNNTVLPGKREEAIPGRPTFPDKQDTLVGSTSPAPDANPQAGCAANDPACAPPTSTNETFKDPQ